MRTLPMNVANRIALGASLALLVLLACRDDPLGPKTNQGVLRVTMNLEQRPDPTSAPETSSGDTISPSFNSSSQPDAARIIIERGDTLRREIQLTQVAGGFEGISPELAAGRYDITVIVSEASRVVNFTKTQQSVVAGDTTDANINVPVFGPTSVSFGQAATTSFSLTARWQGSTQNVDSFAIDIAGNPGFSGATSATVPGNQATFSTTVNSTGTYFARVRAINEVVGQSGAFVVDTVEVVADSAGSGPGVALYLGFGASADGQSFQDFNLAAGEEDWYRIAACVLDQITATVTAGGSFTPQLDILASDQVTVVASGATAVDDVRDHGDRFIRVSPSGGAGNYSLSVQVIPGDFSNVAPEGCVLRTGAPLVFTESDDIFFRSTDGTIRQLTTNAAVDDQAHVGSDFATVVFSSDRSGGVEVFVTDSAASGVSGTGINGSAAEVYPDVSGFISSRPNGGGQLSIDFTDLGGDPRGGIEELIPPDAINADGSFSTNGVTLLYASDIDGDFEIYSMAGGVITQLTDNAATDRAPMFSPDGSMIAWTSDLDGSFDIWIMNADGSNPVNLSAANGLNGTFEAYPQFDGAGRVIFTSDFSGGFELFAMSTNTSDTWFVPIDGVSGGSIVSAVGLEPSIARSAPGLSDLSGSVTPAVASVDAGTTIDVSSAVNNVGAVAAAFGFKLRLFLSADNVVGGDDLLAEIDVPDFVLPGGSFPWDETVTVPATVAPGDYFVLLDIDPGDLVPESNNANNVVGSNPLTVNLPPIPNLVAQAVAQPFDTVFTDSVVNVSHAISNLGGADAPPGWEYTVDLISGEIGTPVEVFRDTSTATLAQQAVDSATQGVTMSPFADLGPHLLRLTADNPDALTEISEADNFANSIPFVLVEELLNRQATTTTFSSASDTIDTFVIDDQSTGGSMLIMALPTAASQADPVLDVNPFGPGPISVDQNGLFAPDFSSVAGEWVARFSPETERKSVDLRNAGSPGDVQVIFQQCFTRSLNLGDEIFNDIISGDCELIPNPISGNFTFAVFNRFSIASQVAVQIDYTASDGTDPTLFLFDETGREVARNDDGGPGLNSRVTTTLAPGDYLALASTFGDSSTSSSLLFSVKLPPVVMTANCQDNTTDLIDVNTAAVINTLPTGACPAAVGVAPNGLEAAIANFNSGDVTIIDLIGQTVDNTISVGAQPLGVSYSPAGGKIYVSTQANNFLIVVDAATQTVTDSILTGSVPRGIAFTPNGATGFVSNQFDNTVSVVNVAADSVVNTIAVQTLPLQPAVRPDGGVVYVPNFSSNTISVIDVGTQAVIATIPVGTNPQSVNFSPLSSVAYVTNRGSGTVSVINTATHTVSNTITVGAGPTGVVFSPGGTRAYVSNESDDNVSVINTSTETVISTVTVGNGPFAIGATLPFAGALGVQSPQFLSPSTSELRVPFVAPPLVDAMEAQQRTKTPR